MRTRCIDDLHVTIGLVSGSPVGGEDRSRIVAGEMQPSPGRCEYIELLLPEAVLEPARPQHIEAARPQQGYGLHFMLLPKQRSHDFRRAAIVSKVRRKPAINVYYSRIAFHAFLAVIDVRIPLMLHCYHSIVKLTHFTQQ